MMNLLTIQLIPDYAIIAGVVILGHWIWLFGIKKGQASTITPSPSRSTKHTDNYTTRAFDNADGEIMSSKSSNYHELITEKISNPEPESLLNHIELQKKGSDVGVKYNGVNILPALETLEKGINPELVRELEELASLTISTEKKYPNATDLN